jgi:predicted  nucleic acid-binding Zn-ribbon protein
MDADLIKLNLQELDKKLAVWDQRLMHLDQQVTTAKTAVAQAVSDVLTTAEEAVKALDLWLSTEGQSLNEMDVQLAKTLKKAVEEKDMTVLAQLGPQMQNLAESVRADLERDVEVFSNALESAATELSIHHGIQI